MPAVGYQGHAGAFSDVAARELVPDAQTRGYPSFDAVAEAVAAGDVEYGVLPVENAIAGPVPRNYELPWSERPARVFGGVDATSGFPRGENAIAGPVPRNYELLWEHPSLRIRGETTLAIELCLIGTTGTSEGTIREVRSHPVALEQVRRYVEARGW